MYISLSKSLAKSFQVKYEDSEITGENLPEYCWYLAKKTVNEEDYLFLINQASRFLIVMEMPEKTNLVEAIKTNIKASFSKIGISENNITDYFKKAGDFKFGKIQNKNLSTWLNSQSKAAIKRLEVQPIKELSTLNAEVNILPVSQRNPKESFLPRIKMENIINSKRMGKKVANNLEIMEIKSELRYSDVKTERTFLIQANQTFEDLNNVLIKLYGFYGNFYHLSNFEIFNKNRKYDPDLIIEEQPDDFYFGFFDRAPQKGLNTRFRYYLETAHHIVFQYDFGDGWNIILKLRKIYPGSLNENKFLPYLLSATGPNPLEDMGGINAYNALIWAKENPEEIEDDDEYLKELLEWTAGEDFNPNYKLELPKKIF